MRHLVNFILLLFFVTLVISGLLRFFKPFEITTTRVHIVFGFGVAALVVCHLLAKPGYYVRMFSRRNSNGRAKKPMHWILVGVVLLAWAGLVAAALWNLPPVPRLIGQGHEARNRAVIFRPAESTASRALDNGFQLRRITDGEAMIAIEIVWGPAFKPGGRFSAPFDNARPQLAIWAESDTGAMIETFFVSEESAFSEGMNWDGNPLRRVDILPIWRHRHTLATGVEPEAEVDTFSAATPEHSFTVSDYLKLDASTFTLNVEVNLPGDTNDFYHPGQPEDSEGYMLPGLGQPSILFSARIEPGEGKKYYLLDFTGHGGSSSEMDGRLFYNTRHLTTARDIIERILVKVVTD